MPRFNYRGRDKSGNLVISFVDAETRDDALMIIDAQGVIPVSVTEKSQFSFDDIVKRWNRPSRSELVLFSTQLGTMLKSGLPITRSLRAIAGQIKNKNFRSAVGNILESIEKGHTFHNSLRAHSAFFDDVYVASVEIGEVTGGLPDILFKLADHIDKDEQVRQRIKNATLYPKIVLSAVFVAIVILVMFVIPRFADLYRNFKTELPLPTRILIKTSSVVETYFPLFIFLFLFIFLAYLYLRHSGPGKKIYDRYILKIPILGDVVTKIMMARFARFFSLLFSSGVVITVVLDLLQKVVDNTVFAEKIKDMQSSIVTGVSVTEAAEKTGFFTPLVQEMISVGEETGSLDNMLQKVSEYYESDLEFSIKNLTTLIEPVLLVGIFGLVLFLALSVFLPMWDMVKFVRQ